MPLNRVRHWAQLWGSTLIDLGNAGHINTESGFGPWPEGLALLQDLQASRSGHPLARTRAAVRQSRL
jgi:predicted alpha/beta hydrolase family esterase